MAESDSWEADIGGGAGFGGGESVEGKVLGEGVELRLEKDVAAALRRKPTNEARLAGCLRCLAPHSARLLEVLADTVEVLVKRASWARPLYASSVRSLAELGDPRASELLSEVLLTDAAGGLASLSAAGATRGEPLARSLARVATSRHPQLAFAAEVARIARGESNGDHITSIAPMIKESHRIDLCGEVLVPLLERPALPLAIAPALSVLRGSERHLGRWLVFAEIGTRAGDPTPLQEASDRAQMGPKSARAAWALVAWALAGDGAVFPEVRPNAELMARLSDRPSAERDSTFLFRLAEAGVPSVQSLLDAMSKGSGLEDATAIRAALYLVKNHGATDLHQALVAAASNSRREALRGVAAAALHDVGARDAALALANKLVRSRQVGTVTWAALIGAASHRESGASLVTERRVRRIQRGWVQ